MTYTRDLKVLALPKNLSGTRALRELHSTTGFIMWKCTIDLYHNPKQLSCK